jgi:hypothetical protein
MKIRLTFFFLCLIFGGITQNYQPFIGKIVYKISNLDRPNDEPLEMTVYSIDSLVRIETLSTVFGNQIFIKHLIRRKSFLLISLDDTNNYAIKGNFEEIDTVIHEKKYAWINKIGTKKIAGIKSKKLKLTFIKSQNSFYCYYAKNYSSKYLDAYRDFPGLPLEYYLETEDGILKYSLTKVDFEIPNYDLFGIPKNYQRVTFDEFVKILTEGQ